MVGRLPAKVERHRVGMPAGTDVVPPMDILGPTRTADGLAGRRLQQTAARAWRRMTIGRRVYASRPGRAVDAPGRLLAAGPMHRSRRLGCVRGQESGCGSILAFSLLYLRLKSGIPQGIFKQPQAAATAAAAAGNSQP